MGLGCAWVNDIDERLEQFKSGDEPCFELVPEESQLSTVLFKNPNVAKHQLFTEDFHPQPAPPLKPTSSMDRSRAVPRILRVIYQREERAMSNIDAELCKMIPRRALNTAFEAGA